MSRSTASTLVFINPTVPDYQNLALGINDAQVIILDPTRDGIEQITQVLNRHAGEIESVHIVSHGAPGEVQLGSTQLNAATLNYYTNQLQSWAGALTQSADILFYGCDVATGESGERFIQQISELTGADVAASTDRTGSAILGGDWKLEAQTGKIESSLAFSQQAMQSYTGVLSSLLNEPFTGSDVTNYSWIYGHAGTAADPYLTARTGTTAPIGGLPGQATASDTAGNGALRLTSATKNQAAFVISNSSVSTSAGLSITFDFSSYGGTGADGIVFFLIDGTANPTQAGGFGGSLGYAQNTSKSQAGLVGGYLGVGYDEYGNFSNPTEGRVGGPGARPDAIAVRGSQANGYKYLTGTAANLPGGIDNTASGATRNNSNRRTQIDITPTGLLSVKIDLNNDGDFADAKEQAITNYNVTTNNGALPANLQFGFSSGTGGSTNIHEIRNLSIQTFTEPPATTDTSIAAAPNGTAKLSGMSATDPDGTIASYFIATLPAASDGTLYLGNPAAGGTVITAGQALTPAQLNQIYFKANSTFNGGSFTYNAVDNQGATDPTPGTVTLVVDSTPPAVAVNFLTTADNTPKLTGTVDDSTAVVKVTVNGQTYTATNNGDGTWTLADNTITTLVDGKYDVTATATNAVGNVGTDSTSNELVIDTTAPVVTVNSLVTSDNTPKLTGTINDATAIVKVAVDGKNYTAANNDDGTWTLADNTIAALADGTYNVTATATDSNGNVGTDSTVNELTIDTTAPVVTVNSRITNDSTPQLTGTVDDPTAVITLVIDGKSYTASNKGDGTWVLLDNTISPALADDVYDIQATAIDALGNAGTDNTINELTVDQKAPIVTINSLQTNDSTPRLTGMISDPAAVIKVSVNNQTYTAVNNGDGTWILPNDTISPALKDGIYDVQAIATSDLDNTGNDASINELVVDTKPPIVTVNALITGDSTPQLTGTVDDPTSTIIVAVDGQTYAAENNGDGTWTLPDNIISPALINGIYDVSVTAEDALGNTGIDSTIGELTVNTALLQVILQPIDSSTGEDGSTAQFQVKLNSQPTADVVLSFSSSDPTEGILKNTAVTFTPANWNRPQTVTVIGVDDATIDGDITYQIKTTVSSSDAQYSEMAVPDVAIVNIDNDKPHANQPPIVENVAVTVTPGRAVNIAQLVATDPDSPISNYVISTLPSAAQGQLFLGDPAQGGMLVQVGQLLAPAQIKQLFFQATDAFSGSQFTYTAVDSTGLTARTAATVVLSASVSQIPICQPGATLKGTRRKDILKGTFAADWLRGFKGNDVLHGWGCNDVIQGNRGNDRLFGDNGRDLLLGGLGNDQLRGGNDDDLLRGGRGRDRLFGGAGKDTLQGGRDADRLSGNQDNDRLLGGVGDDTLRGGADDDFLEGNRGQDLLRGGGGNDVLQGNTGDDRVWGGKGDDVLKGGLGNDRLNGSQGNDVIYGQRNDDILRGRQGDDILYGQLNHDWLLGGQGQDQLYGGRGRDRLNGGAGNDRLIGGQGADTLIGGKGQDQFVYTSMNDHGDRILDFDVNNDVIDLRRLFGTRPSGSFKDLLKLSQVGSNAVIQVAPTGGNNSKTVLATLEGVSVSTLQQQNFLIS
jgi:Ca2+-binding RTX toxin-like protein